MAIVYPHVGSEIYIPATERAGRPGDFRAVHQRRARLYWHLDAGFLARHGIFMSRRSCRARLAYADAGG